MEFPKTYAVHLKSNELGVKEHLAFNRVKSLFFSLFDSLKIPRIKQTNLRPVLRFNEFQVLANPL